MRSRARGRLTGPKRSADAGATRSWRIALSLELEALDELTIGEMEERRIAVTEVEEARWRTIARCVCGEVDRMGC